MTVIIIFLLNLRTTLPRNHLGEWVRIPAESTLKDILFMVLRFDNLKDYKDYIPKSIHGPTLRIICAWLLYDTRLVQAKDFGAVFENKNSYIFQLLSRLIRV